MELQTIIQAAMQLGVIPVVALYLVYRLNAQNQKLVEMLDQRDKDMTRWLELVIQDMIALKAKTRKKGETGGN